FQNASCLTSFLLIILDIVFLKTRNMALNKYMHPRNLYRTKKPNFKELAQKYDFFQEVAISDEHGRVSLDFKIPAHLSALSKALLLEDFNLNVEFPLDRLVPTVPLRLNYILWLEDVIKKSSSMTYCETYRLLPKSIHNVMLTSCFLHLHILVIQIKDGASSLDAVFSHGTPPESYLTAVMANPPFFCGTSDAVGTTTNRSITRPASKTVSSAARHECQTQGGEVLFGMRLARDSVKYAARVGVFTVMLGKKSSVVPLKRILRKLNIQRISVYELCQGRIMRWGLAWTFQPNVEFPESEFRRLRKLERPPLKFELPPKLSCLPHYTVDALLDWLRNEFRQLKMRVLDQKNRAEIGGFHLSVCATENTWTHNRRKRREAERLSNSQQIDSSGIEPVNNDSSNRSEQAASNESHSPEKLPSLKRPLDPDFTEPEPATEVNNNNPDVDRDFTKEVKRRRLAEVCEEGDAWVEDDIAQVTLTSEHFSMPVGPSPTPPIIQADVFVEQSITDSSSPNECGNGGGDDDECLLSSDPSGPLVVKIVFTGGSCREAANQIMCYLKNRLR
ncbi:methyltransferase-like protein 16, partial [Clonorchis sinensis]